MGQQQLLLLVLGIVIVGIAILVGINAYSENSVKTNWDALLQDGLRIASDAQAWKAKPELFGGSPDAVKADSNDFAAVDFTQLAYSQAMVGTTQLCYVNINGTYTMIPTADGLTITGQNLNSLNQVQLTVNGSLEQNIDLVEASSIQGGANSATGVETAITYVACTL